MRARWYEKLGPGLLLAAAAIGVSHLVQSTRAGATFGFELLGLVILVNVLKYPFFEFGHRYYAATGQDLLEGYKRMGRGYLAVFLPLNILSAVGSFAGVTLIAAALCQSLFYLPIGVWTLILFASASALLLVGRFRALNLSIRILMAGLLITTLLALFLVFLRGPVASPDYQSPSPWSWASLPFLLALMGWMPAPIEGSVWQGLWMREREKFQKYRVSLKDALFDFNFGYLASTLSALAFILLGAYVMYGSGKTFATQSHVFSGQLISMYTSALGSWTRPIILICAITTMFSTLLTLVDAYPRSIAQSAALLWPQLQENVSQLKTLTLSLIYAASLSLLWVLGEHLTLVVDAVTLCSFLTAPIFAWLNYKLILNPWVKKADRPNSAVLLLAKVGLIFLSLFSLVFIASLVLDS